jgi:hypothetical protein
MGSFMQSSEAENMKTAPFPLMLEKEQNSRTFVYRRRDRRIADMPKHDLWRLFHVTERRKAERRLLLVDQPDNRRNENKNHHNVVVFHNA